MKRYISEDKKIISLPVPLGSIIYQVNTTCGDFCLFQKEKFDKLTPDRKQCFNKLPCHTIEKEPIKIELTINNLSLLNEWEKTVFETYEKAKEKTKEIINKNIKVLEDNNILLDKRGYSKTTKLQR